MLPFTQTQFFDLFQRYNEAIWPAQIVAYVLAVGVVASIITGKWARQVTLLSLAVLWAWTGVVYHVIFFVAINPAANMFGALFVAQAVAFACYALRPGVQFAPRGPAHFIAWSMILYASVIYPLLNTWLGHAYPGAPTFGVTPCPLVIFTLGVLLLTPARTPWPLLAAPLIWSAIGGAAAILLGVAADWALPVVGVLAVAINARKPRASGYSAEAGAAAPSHDSSSRSASR